MIDSGDRPLKRERSVGRQAPMTPSAGSVDVQITIQ